MHLTLQSVYPVVIIVFFCIKNQAIHRISAAEASLAFYSYDSFSMFAFGLTIFSLIHPFLYGYFIIGILGGCLLVFSPGKISPLKNAEEKFIFGLIFG